MFKRARYSPTLLFLDLHLNFSAANHGYGVRAVNYAIGDLADLHRILKDPFEMFYVSAQAVARYDDFRKHGILRHIPGVLILPQARDHGHRHVAKAKSFDIGPGIVRRRPV